MRDRLALLFMGIACAVTLWAFFKYAGEAGPMLMLGLFVFGSSADNLRLRREIRKLRERLDSEHEAGAQRE